MRKPVHGIGINDADYVVDTHINGKRILCPIYARWTNMISRCYSKKYQEKQPTYIGCTVCEEWLVFSNFKKWMDKQDWKGKCLDKDLLVSGNKVYGPDVCMFVPEQINNLVVTCIASRGCYPLGVSLEKNTGKFHSQLRIKSKTKNIGRFDCPHEAHQAWQRAKIAVIIETASAEDDERLVAALNRIADKVMRDLVAGVETKIF